MNDRIQELIDQSSTMSWDVDRAVTTVDARALAELIVRECAQVANDSNQLKNRPMGVSVGDVVMKRFGI